MRVIFQNNLLRLKHFYIGAYVGGGGAAAATEVTDEVVGDETEGHWKEGPDMIISLMRVSIGVLPTNRTKKSCSITCDDTVSMREVAKEACQIGLADWDTEYDNILLEHTETSLAFVL